MKKRNVIICAVILLVLIAAAAVKTVFRIPVPGAKEITGVRVAPAGNSHWPEFSDASAIRRVRSGCAWAFPIGSRKPEGFGGKMTYAVDFLTSEGSSTVYVTSKGMVDIIAMETDGKVSYWVTYPWYDARLGGLKE